MYLYSGVFSYVRIFRTVELKLRNDSTYCNRFCVTMLSCTNNLIFKWWFIRKLPAIRYIGVVVYIRNEPFHNDIFEGRCFVIIIQSGLF